MWREESSRTPVTGLPLGILVVWPMQLFQKILALGDLYLSQEESHLSARSPEQQCLMCPASKLYFP